MGHPDNEILFIKKRLQTTDTCYNIEEPQKHYARWNKPGAKDPFSIIPLIWNTQKIKT